MNLNLLHVIHLRNELPLMAEHCAEPQDLQTVFQNRYCQIQQQQQHLVVSNRSSCLVFQSCVPSRVLFYPLDALILRKQQHWIFFLYFVIQNILRGRKYKISLL